MSEDEEQQERDEKLPAPRCVEADWTPDPQDLSDVVAPGHPRYLPSVTRRQFIEALDLADGNLTKTQAIFRKRLGKDVSLAMIKKVINEDALIKRFYLSLEDSVIDESYDVVKRHIRAQSLNAATWFITYVEGKRRLVEKTDQSAMANGVPILGVIQSTEEWVKRYEEMRNRDNNEKGQ